MNRWFLILAMLLVALLSACGSADEFGELLPDTTPLPSEELEAEEVNSEDDFDDPDFDPYMSQVYTDSRSVSNKSYVYYYLNQKSGYRYTICLNISSGDADLYGALGRNPTTSSYESSSTHGGLTDDCITVDATSNSTYYIGVYGYASGTSTYTIRVTYSDSNYVPSWLQRQLVRPNNCTSLTHQKYGPFNSPWGNTGHDPFYEVPKYRNYIHTGTDFSCSPGTAVKAVCNGNLRTGDLGSESGYWWGYYVLEECSINGNKVTIAYDHLKTVTTATTATAGQTTIGTIADLTYPNEPDHLHLGVCLGSMDTCRSGNSSRASVQQGADLDSKFPGLTINSNATTLWK